MILSLILANPGGGSLAKTVNSAMPRAIQGRLSDFLANAASGMVKMQGWSLGAPAAQNIAHMLSGVPSEKWANVVKSALTVDAQVQNAVFAILGASSEFRQHANDPVVQSAIQEVAKVNPEAAAKIEAAPEPSHAPKIEVAGPVDVQPAPGHGQAVGQGNPVDQGAAGADIRAAAQGPAAPAETTRPRPLGKAAGGEKVEQPVKYTSGVGQTEPLSERPSATSDQRQSPTSAHTSAPAAEAKPQDTSAAGKETGALTPETPTKPPESTGIKNAAIDDQLAKYGQRAAIHGEKITVAGVHEEAARTMESDPFAGQKLVNEITNHPRALSGQEDALVLREQVRLKLEHAKADAQLQAAIKSGDPVALTTARDAAAKAMDDYIRTADAVTKAGTVWGQGGRLRQEMMKDDYSLEARATRLSNALGRKLTDTEMDGLRAKTKQIQADLDALTARNEATEARAAKAEADLKISELNRQAAEKRSAGVAEPRRGNAKATEYGNRNRFVTREAYEKARQELADFGKLYSGIPVDKLAALVKVGAFHIEAGANTLADFTEKMVGEFGEKVRPHLQEVYAKATEQYGDGVRADMIEKMKARIADGADANDLHAYFNKLALELVRDGTTDREKLIDALHEQVKGAVPGITREQTRDILSGYGDLKRLDPETAKSQLRDIKAESLKLAQLEAIERKQAPVKTGIERQPPNTETRRLTKLVNEGKKKLGIVSGDPATRLKTTLDSMKTRARNTIGDLQSEIDTKTRIIHGRPTPITDTELDALRAQVAELRKAHEEVFGKREMTDEQRLKMATSAAARNMELWNKRLADAKAGKFDGPDTKRTLEPSPELESLRAKTEAARNEFKSLRNADPTYQASATSRANQEYRTRLAQRESDLLDRIAKVKTGDLSKPPKRETLALDPESKTIQARVNRTKQMLDAEVRRAEESQRPLWLKAMGQFAGAARAAALSGYHTLGKLAGYSAAKLAETPINEASGKLLDLIPSYKRIGQQAPNEGGESAKALAKFYTSFATKGMRDAWRQLRTGTTDNRLVYDKPESHTPHWYDFFSGNLHASEKTPLLTADFDRALEHQKAWGIAHGIDIHDPLVQGAMNKDAFEYAHRAILMEPNAAAAEINGLLARMESPKKDTGKVSGFQASASELIKIFLTKGIVKTPANYVMQTLERTPVGLARGIWKAESARRSGIEVMDPHTADVTRRLLKVGMAGSAMFIWGAVDATRDEKHRVFGGYYQPGQKRSEDDAHWGGIRIGGVSLPHLLTHNPMTEVAQMGSTMMRVAMAGVSKKDKTQQGIVSGVITSVLGLAEQAPIASTAMRLKLGNPTQRDGLVGTLLVGLIPQVVQNVAQDTDSATRGNDNVYRKPVGVGQQLENAIPGLRERVPLKKQSAPVRRQSTRLRGEPD
jgi:hypothetical protein